MANALVDLLKANGCRGKDHTMTRTEAARRLSVTVRQVTLMGRESRKMVKDGHFDDVVCFSKAGKDGGLFLASCDDDILDAGGRLKHEALTLLVELKWLSKALSVNLYQGRLYEGIEEIMPHVPDQIEERSPVRSDTAGRDDRGADSGVPAGTP